MKNIKWFVILFTIVSCTNNQKNTAHFQLNANLLEKIESPLKKYIIISCNRCSCIDSTLRGISADDKKYLSGFTIIGNSKCLKTNFPFVSVRQSFVDSISEDIYDVTLLKKENGVYQTKIIEADESSKFISICRKFFK